MPQIRKLYGNGSPPSTNKSQQQSTRRCVRRVVVSFYALVVIVFFAVQVLFLGKQQEGSGADAGTSATTTTTTTTTTANNSPLRRALAPQHASAILPPRPLPTVEDKEEIVQTTTNSSSLSIFFSLDPIDMTQYTVRLNSWKRPEQLKIAIDHYQSCDSVAQIQVVWCTAQGDPPEWLSQQQGGSKQVIVELHELNSLNERFHVLHEPPTRGILSVDDDVLRPCIALDAGFFKWTQHPDRMVGYDARAIEVDHKHKTWKYGYLSTTKRTNHYSLTLSRFAFVHLDYFKSYMVDMPQSIRDKVEANLNCEDIALSLWVSSRTNGQVPLLADYWAMQSMVKLHHSGAISGMSGHKHVRDECVEEFTTLLKLKEKLVPARWVRAKQALFACGVETVDEESTAQQQQGVTIVSLSPRLAKLQAQVAKWKKMYHKDVTAEVNHLMNVMSRPAFAAGLIEGTGPWKERYNK
jgi:glucuronyl/N-acetylglucosaminyl transferase EXT2